jgi:F-type H+-transporting ATPase subunit delta
MNNPRLAIRYAKSLVQLAQEQNSLEEVNKDIRYLQAVAQANKEFVTVLRSPVIPSDKKEKILNAVTEGNIGKLTSTFIRFLINKGRELNLTEIINAFIDQYNTIRNIRRVKITTAEPMSNELKSALVQQVAGEGNIENVEVEEVVDEGIIGGFILETEGRLVDGSIRRDLLDVKKQFMNNDYVHKLR